MKRSRSEGRTPSHFMSGVVRFELSYDMFILPATRMTSLLINNHNFGYMWWHDVTVMTYSNMHHYGHLHTQEIITKSFARHKTLEVDRCACQSEVILHSEQFGATGTKPHWPTFHVDRQNFEPIRIRVHQSQDRNAQCVP